MYTAVHFQFYQCLATLSNIRDSEIKKEIVAFFE